MEAAGGESVLHPMRLDPAAIDFAAFGIPEHIASVLRQRQYPSEWARYWNRIIALSLVVVILGCALPGALLFVAIPVEDARAARGIFYDGDVGLGVIVLMIGSILCSAWVASYLDRLFPVEVREYLTVRGFEMGLRSGGLGALVTCWLYRRAARDITTTEPTAFLREQAATMRRWMAIGAVVLTLGGAALVTVEFSAYDLGTEHGIERHSISGVEHVPYDAVEAVEVGCVSAGRNTRGIYDLVLRDGDRIPALSGRWCCGDRLQRLARLDADLRQRGVRVRAATDDEGRPQLDTACEEHIADRAAVPVDVVHRLLNP